MVSIEQGESKEMWEKITFPKDAEIVMYQFPWTKNPLQKTLNEDEKNWKEIKKWAPEWAYSCIFKDKYSKTIKGIYILDWIVKSTQGMDEEDFYFDREANTVRKVLWKCTTYVKTRIKNLFLKFDPELMKMV